MPDSEDFIISQHDWLGHAGSGRIGQWADVVATAAPELVAPGLVGAHSLVAAGAKLQADRSMALWTHRLGWLVVLDAGHPLDPIAPPTELPGMARVGSRHGSLSAVVCCLGTCRCAPVGVALVADRPDYLDGSRVVTCPLIEWILHGKSGPYTDCLVANHHDDAGI